MKTPKTIAEYFKDNPENDLEYWNTDLNCYHLSGFALLPKIAALKPQTMLDLGCGYNEFKPYFPQLIGIDLSNTSADVIGDFLDYQVDDNSQDVILALGSINFLGLKTVSDQVAWIYRKLKPGGTAFIRVNPAQAPDDSITEEFYVWSIEDIYNFTTEHAWTIKDGIILYEDRLPSEKLRGAEGFPNIKLSWQWIK
jgi:SAM-dependent methyltransferase